jgi:hypothetical protein
MSPELEGFRPDDHDDLSVSVLRRHNCSGDAARGIGKSLRQLVRHGALLVVR